MANSDVDQPFPSIKHNRTSSSDQSRSQTSSNSSTMQNTIEHEDTPASPNEKSKSEKHKFKRRKNSSASTTTTSKSRPVYSRKYSTPPSRPLSPSGYPQHLESDGLIPDLDLSQLNDTLSNNYRRHNPHHYPHQQQQQQPVSLEVDTAPQDPDLWDEPETDYFSTFEGAPTRHARAKSRRQVSQSLASGNQLISGGSAANQALMQISEDAEFELPPTPGAWGG